MNEDVLNQILAEVKKISVILEQKRNRENLQNDLSSYDLKTATDACNKVGNS